MYSCEAVNVTVHICAGNYFEFELWVSCFEVSSSSQKLFPGSQIMVGYQTATV
jgi:hypothetical protein